MLCLGISNPHSSYGRYRPLIHKLFVKYLSKIWDLSTSLTGTVYFTRKSVWRTILEPRQSGLVYRPLWASWYKTLPSSCRSLRVCFSLVVFRRTRLPGLEVWRWLEWWQKHSNGEDLSTETDVLQPTKEYWSTNPSFFRSTPSVYLVVPYTMFGFYLTSKECRGES